MNTRLEFREILDIKHGGIEKFGFKYTYLGTSVSPEKFIDAAVVDRRRSDSCINDYQLTTRFM